MSEAAPGPESEATGPEAEGAPGDAGEQPSAPAFGADVVAPRVLRSISSSVLFDVVSTVATIVSTRLLLRSLGAEAYGLGVTLDGLVGYLGLADLGLGQAVTRHVARLAAKRDRQGLERILDTAFGLYALLGALALALALVALPFIGAVLHLSPELTRVGRAYFAVVALRFALGFPVALYGGVCTGLGRFDLYNAGRLVGTVASFGLVMLAVASHAGLFELGLFTFAAPFVTAAVHRLAIARLLPGLRFRPLRLRRDAARELFAFSIYFWINGLVVLLVLQTDNVVIASTLGVGFVSAYAITQRLLTAGMEITFKLSDAVFPTYAGLGALGDRKALRRHYLEVTRYSVATSLAVATVLLIAGPSLVRAWTGDAGFAGPEVLACFVAVLVIHTPVHVASGLIAACGSLERLTAFSVLEGALNLGLSIYLAPRLGVAGVALGTLVSMAVTTAWFVPRSALSLVDIGLGEYLVRGVGAGVLWMAPVAALGVAVGYGWQAKSIPIGIGQGAALSLLAAALLLALRRATRQKHAPNEPAP